MERINFAKEILSMINDNLKMVGAMTATLVRENGDVEVTKKNNIIVDDGFDFICDAMANSSSRPAAMGWIEVGESSAGLLPANDGLGSPELRKAATYDHTTGTKVFTLTTTFDPGEASVPIVEAGVFNTATLDTGTMLDRVTFPAINKGPSDSLTVQFSFTLS